MENIENSVIMNKTIYFVIRREKIARPCSYA